MKDAQVLRNKKKLLPGSGMSYHQFQKPTYKIIQSFNSPLTASLRTVTFTGNEMTALCPLTGFPDQYSYKISYKPRVVCAESKSVKHYLGSYRDFGGFIETIAQRICDDWFVALNPVWIKVELTMNPRGGVAITTVVER